jgi:hypothetical protein
MGVNPVGTNVQPGQQPNQAAQPRQPWTSRHPYLAAGAMGAGPLTMAMGALNGGDFGSMLFGKKARNEQMPLYNQQGMDTLSFLQSQGRQNADFGPIEERYKKQFEEETIPGLAERFTTLGGQRSSGFQRAALGAGADFNSQMAALRSQHGMRQLEMGLRPQFENIRHERQPGFFENVGSSIMSLAPKMLGMGL